MVKNIEDDTERYNTLKNEFENYKEKELAIIGT